MKRQALDRGIREAVDRAIAREIAHMDAVARIAMEEETCAEFRERIITALAHHSGALRGKEPGKYQRWLDLLN
ncbi:MAG: hypothetical protein IT566_16315 [Rhodospirillaceae bacterium]|nr:hypothetical protein [Rhodospirillaceae bacterium]